MQVLKVPERIKNDRRINQARFRLRKKFNWYRQWERHVKRMYEAIDAGLINDQDLKLLCDSMEKDDQHQFVRLMKAFN